MKDHDGCKRGFYRSGKAWYAEAIGGDTAIHVGMYHEEGGSSGEMSVHWISLGGKSVPQLRAFDDSWSSLFLFTDLVAEMAEVDDQNVTEEQFVEMLLKCGFEDQTQYINPNDKSPRSKQVARIAQLEDELKAERERLSSTSHH